MSLPKSRLPFVAGLTLAVLVGAMIVRLPSNTGSISNAIETEDWQNKVEASVLNAAATGSTEFFIAMTSQADLSGANALTTKDEKGQFVYQQLTSTAAASQSGVMQTLNAFAAEHQAFWITNGIWAKGGLDVIQAVASRTDVAYVYASGYGRLNLPAADTSGLSDGSTTSTVSALAADPNPEPGLVRVNADDVWALGIEGQGAIVAGADTGVSWQHPALRKQYRGWNDATQTGDHNYNWHDSIHRQGGGGECGADSKTPCDDNSHGTHTLGTMLGDDVLDLWEATVADEPDFAMGHVGRSYLRSVSSEGPAAAEAGEVAERWRYRDGAGEIGVISSVTQAFCASCNRLRLSAEGSLYTCLFAEQGHDLKWWLRHGGSDAEIVNEIAAVWRARADRYSEIRTAETAKARKVEMSYIGG